METLDTYVEFVKEQLTFQERMAKKYLTQPYRENLHRTSATRFRELLSILESLRDGPPAPLDQLPKPVAARRRIMLSLDDIKDIPDELLDELNLSDSDKQDMLIESIIAEAGGILSLDKILVELYRSTGIVHKRNIVISRLYRMGNRGLIYSLPSKKGLYSTYELSEQDVKRLFGQLDTEADGPAVGTPNISGVTSIG